MIKIEKISKTYGKGQNAYTALKDISFEVKDGETVAIVGKSGSGKSTLMHAISGLDRADKGKVLINDLDICKLTDKEADKFRNKEIGFIFQTFFLQGNESVLNNVMLPLEIEGMTYSIRKEKALNALKLVDLEDKANSMAKNLSGGQKQRVCIARAIVSEPKIIFADEPTGNLDSENGTKIVNLLFDLNKKLEATLFIVTHDKELAAKCEKKIYLKDGEIVNHNEI